MIPSHRHAFLAASFSLALLATRPVDAAQEIVVLGSSVAAGTGASPTSQAWAYRFENLMENQAPIVPGSTVTWQVNNASIGGDNTTKVLARFQNDVVNTYPGTDIVIISLSLANEGLVGASDPEAIFNSFKNGLSQIIDLCRSNGYYPIISLPYPHGTYTTNEYAYVRRMNLLLNTWNIPSFNYLGALDDGSGRWAPGYWSDSYHPNNSGHAELFYAVVPSMFDAITAGKTTSPQIAGTNGFLRMQRDAAEASPVRFTPAHTTHSFTMSFRVRSTDVGTVASVNSGSSRATLEIRDNAFVYVGPTGSELSAPMDANDGHWHDVALSHRYATGQSLLFIDGVLKGTVSDNYVPDQFVLDGAAGASGRALAPLQADFQDVCIYRAAWTHDEAMAQSKGALQQASLEICAPLADASPVSGAAFENRAQSMSSMSLFSSNTSAQAASIVPDGLTVGATTGSTVNLTWTPHGGGVFTIERRRTGVAEAWSTAGTSPNNTPSFTDTGLLPGTSYDYRVSTQDGTFQSDYSNVVSALTTQTVPAGSLLWDSDSATAGAQDGSGTWDVATTARWYNGSTTQTWSNSTSPSNIARFGAGGTSGTVTLATTMNAGGLYFTQTGYILNSGTLNLSPATGTPFIYSTNGGTSTLNSTVTSAGGALITKTGPGTLLLGNGGGGSGTTPALYTVTGGTFNSTTGVFDSIFAMPAGNRLGVQAAAPTTVLTLDAGTFQVTSATGNALATNRKVQVNAAGGAISDFGSGNFYQPLIANNAGAGSSLYLSNISGITQFQGIISGTGSVTWYGAGTASFQAANTYSGGTNVMAGVVSVTQNSALGTGILSFSGNGTLQSGAAGLNLPNNIALGTTSDVFDTNGNTFTLSGAISNSAATNNAIKVNGSGTLILAGNLDVTGHASDTNSPALMMGSRNGATFSRGTVTITGSGNLSRISTGWDNTANVLNFASTGTLTMATDLVSGQSANGAGVINFTSGTLNLQNFNIANWDGAYGGFTMSGGTMNATNLRNGGNGNGNGSSYSLMTGGTINVAEVTTLSRNGTGTNILHLKGASAQFNEGNNRFNLGFSTGSTGIITVENGLLTVASNLSLAEGGTGSTAVVNLNGGIIRPNVVVTPNTSGASIFNFNGGTLQANIDHASFMGGLTQANVYAGGATIDTNGKSIAISQVLQSASGSGVSSIAVATGGAGYLGIPVVKITGGGGTGATAVASISGGVVTGIQITSAGTGYTGTPTATLIGGGATTAATLGTITTTANATTGGLTKTGTGMLTLSGANTYNGSTAISNGVLATNNLQANGAASGIGQGTALNLNGGTLRYTGGSNNSGFNRTITVGASGGTLDNSGGNFVFYSGSLSGSGTLTVLDSSSSAHEWLVTGGSPGFSGNIQIGNGTAGSGNLQYRSNNASPFGGGVIQINGGGVLTADNGATVPGTLGNNIVLNGGTLGTQQANMNYTGTVSLQAGSKVGHAYNGTTGTVTLSGAISGGSGAALNISTATTVTISNTNSYTGPTNVNAGKLIVNGNISTSVLTTVNSGGTIAGIGTTGDLTVAAGGTIAAGNSIGTLNAGNTVLAGTLAVELNDTTSDLLNITGNLDVTGATINISQLAAPAAAKYVIAKYTGTLTGTASSTTVPAGYSLVHDTAAKEIQLVQAPVGFSSFMDGFSGLSAADKLPDADPDHDGISNLLEYALDGMDPTTANASPGTLAGNIVTYTKRAAAVSNNDLTYAIIESSTLDASPATWAEVNAYLVNDTTTISGVLPAGQPKEFVRLKVSRN